MLAGQDEARSIMGTPFEATDRTRSGTAISPASATRRPALLEPQVRVTILEHAFRALRADPPGASPGELGVHRRLRTELLEAAATQFVGRCNGLARADASGGTLLLTEECCGCGGWRITHFDGAMNPIRHVHFEAERDAIRALILAQA